MSLLTSQLQTGLLQYSRKKDFIGPGFTFKETELITIDCFVTDFANFSPTLLQSEIENTFNSLYSGNVYCKAFQIESTFNGNSDSIRIAHFHVTIENRLPILNLSNLQPELTQNYFAGINDDFWANYGPDFNSFTEYYDYAKKDDGNLETNHSIAFTTLTGNYNSATGIANYIYNADIATSNSNAFYTNLTQLIFTPNPLTFIDPTQTRQYYTESYDLLKNNYSFTKKTTYPPIGTDNNLNVNKNIKNTIVLGEDGIITVSEEGKIKAFLDFNQSVLEFNTTQPIIFSRCNDFYNAFATLSNVQNGTLNDWPIKNDVIYNKPGLMVDYVISFTDNPNFNSLYDTITQKTIKIDLIEEKYINIEHSYDFTRLAHITFDQTGVMMSAIETADTESSSIITGIYQNSEVYNPYLPNLPRIKEMFTLPNRKRTFSANFMYSNEPIFFININGTIYPKLQYKIINDTPDNIVNEYKVINRPSQTSVLSYAYQTQKGSKTIQINGYLIRNYGQTFTSPQNINNQFIPLFNWGVQTLMNSFNNENVLAFSYYLNDVKIEFNSENEYTMNIQIVYTKKLYV